MSEQGVSVVTRIVKSLALIEANEIKASLASFGLVFMLMAAYYILRPVRDSMASEWSDATVSTLWTFTFLFSFIATAIYGFAVARIKLKLLVPSVYCFFALTFIAIYFLTRSMDAPDQIGKVFYVWVSVFSLFQISVFWSFMSDLFSKEQSKRLFGFITTGASIGAIAGPAIPAIFATGLGNANLLLIASLILLATVPVIFLLQNLKRTQLGGETTVQTAQMNTAVGGNPLAGYKVFLQTPFLLGIGAFIFLYTGIGSFVYFELKNMLADYPDSERTRIWALMDFVTNSLTIVMGLFVTSRLAAKLGVGFTLALIPVLIVGGLLTVAFLPLVWMVVGLQIFRRAGNFGVTRPAREMLFTVVDRETRFKAKQVIDVVVYRGGDVFWGWSFTALTALFGLGVTGVALVGAAVAAVWAMLGIYLGRSFASRENSHVVQHAGTEQLL